MKRVLIPSGQLGLVSPLADAYARRGFDVVIGLDNFWLRGARFDLVHFQWPEELTDWAPPSEAALERLAETLDWWVERAETVVTVHNFYPHLFEGNRQYHKLYQLFYERCGGIVHHSRTSIDLIHNQWPGSLDRRHAIGVCRSFPQLIRPGSDRSASRQKIGVHESDFAILVFGALRTWDECRLIFEAFDRAKIPRKRLIMAGRYDERMALGEFEKRYRRYQWRFWLKSRNAVRSHGFMPDDEIHQYFEAADAIVIPRLKDLSSGIVGLAMTFGKLLIAPDHGAFPEYIAGTDNLLYMSSDSASLAQAFEKAARIDPQRVAVINRDLAERTRIDETVEAALQVCGWSVPEAGRSKIFDSSAERTLLAEKMDAST